MRELFLSSSTMDVHKSVFLLLVFLVSFLPCGEAAQSDEHLVNAYDNILKALKLNNSLELQNLTTLLRRLGLHNCSNQANHHHKVTVIFV